MVQFNLLPDVKLEHVKAQRTKRTVITGALALTGLAVFVLVLLFMVVNVFQKQHLSNLNEDIKAKTSQLKNTPDLDKVLTVQNQLMALTGLHEQKPATSRMATYLTTITPVDAKVAEFNINFEEETMTISGTAGSLQTINKFADVIKFAEYKDGTTQDRAFSQVVLSNFGVGKTTGDGRSTYTMALKYNPDIFDNTKTIELVVPNIISTRSVTESPGLFEPKPAELQGQN